MSIPHVKVTARNIACMLAPLAVTNPAPSGNGMLYEYTAHIEIDALGMLERDGRVREEMIQIFTLALDEMIKRNTAVAEERKRRG